MSKSKMRKSRTVLGKSSDNGAFRFLKIRHGDKRWLLAHTAIVAGTMGVAMIGAPSIAMADPGCASTGINLANYEQFNCNGILDPAAATVVVLPSEDYQMFVDGTGDGEFIGEVSNPAVIHVNTQGEDIYGYIEIRDGAELDNADGDGFVLESAGYTEITNDGYIRGGQGEDGSVGLRVIGGGEVHLTNNSHIEGADAGVYVDGASEARLANHSYNSVMGGNGFEVVNSTGYVEVDNEAGLTAGLTEDGVFIDGVIDADGYEDEAVAVYNGDSGIIVGSRDGVAISNVQEGAGEEADVAIHNSAYWDGEDHVEGGFIAGVNGDGIYVTNVYDDVEIYNAGTRGVGIDFLTITDGGIDPRVYSLSEESLLLQPGGLFGDSSEEGLVPSRGIWGYWDGVNIVDVDDVRIHNTAYSEDGFQGGLIVGGNGAGVSVEGSEDVDISNEAGLIWGGEDGISLYDSETASIRNADGTIMGYEGIGIDIGPTESWFSEEWMSYEVDIYNASEDGWNGGIIAGDDQAIRVAAHDIFIANGTGGAILGNGFSDNGYSEDYYGPAIIELYSSSEDFYSGGVQVYNEGLIASWYTDESVEDGYLPHIDWYDELDFASTGGSEEDDGLFLDLDAINSDIAAYADFVWSGGADGSLFNDDTGTALSEYGTGATALAISSLGMSSEDFGFFPFSEGFNPGAGVDVYNGQDGVIIGRVALFGDSYLDFNEDTGYAGASVRNEGVWYVKDSGIWGMMGPMC